MAGINDTWKKLTDSLSAATTDLALIVEFAAVNYLGGFVNTMATGAVGGNYWTRLAVSEGITSLTDLTKFALWTISLNTGKNTPKSN